MAKNYKIGQQLKINNAKVVVTAVDPKTGAATINYAAGSGKTGFAGTLQGTGNLKGKVSVEFDFETVDNNSYDDYDSVSYKDYANEVTASSVISSAEKLKGKKLTKEEAKAAETLGEWFEKGDIKTSVGFSGRDADFLIKFSDKFPPIQKGDKTIGVVQIGMQGNDYFYEVENGQVSFRHANGVTFYGKTKLPLNYGMRKTLDGQGIQDQNRKWAIEGFTNSR